MFVKNYTINENHIDFQGIVDGLYYPFYLEWARHAFMKETLGLDLEKEAEAGRLHMILEYNIRFRKSLKADQHIQVTCKLAKNEKRNRVNFLQEILVDGVVYAEATFIATCLSSGRPVIPQEVAAALLEA